MKSRRNYGVCFKTVLSQEINALKYSPIQSGSVINWKIKTWKKWTSPKVVLGNKTFGEAFL